MQEESITLLALTDGTEVFVTITVAAIALVGHPWRQPEGNDGSSAGGKGT